MKRFTIALLTTVVGAGLMSSAYAADLIIDEPAPVGVVDVSGNWDGPYVGVFAGWGVGEAVDTNDDFGIPDQTIDLSGWLLGVTAGANFSISDGIVAGVVGDIAWSDIGGEDTNNPSTFDINWAASLRGRLGFDGGAFLPYLTAGLAVAGVDAFDDPDADSGTYVGWTVGAGVEFAVADNVSIDLLYRYSDYGSQDFDLGYADLTPLALTTHTVQVGLNLSF